MRRAGRLALGRVQRPCPDAGCAKHQQAEHCPHGKCSKEPSRQRARPSRQAEGSLLRVRRRVPALALPRSFFPTWLGRDPRSVRGWLLCGNAFQLPRGCGLRSLRCRALRISRRRCPRLLRRRTLRASRGTGLLALQQAVSPPWARPVHAAESRFSACTRSSRSCQDSGGSSPARANASMSEASASGVPCHAIVPSASRIT